MPAVKNTRSLSAVNQLCGIRLIDGNYHNLINHISSISPVLHGFNIKKSGLANFKIKKISSLFLQL